MGTINQNANMYNKNGELICRAGNYPKNIYLNTIGSQVFKQNAGVQNPKYFAWSKKRKG